VLKVTSLTDALSTLVLPSGATTRMLPPWLPSAA
jgi:hypothetical protein